MVHYNVCPLQTGLSQHIKIWGTRLLMKQISSSHGSFKKRFLADRPNSAMVCTRLCCCCCRTVGLITRYRCKLSVPRNRTSKSVSPVCCFRPVWKIQLDAPLSAVSVNRRIRNVSRWCSRVQSLFPRFLKRWLSFCRAQKMASFVQYLEMSTDFIYLLENLFLCRFLLPTFLYL